MNLGRIYVASFAVISAVAFSPRTARTQTGPATMQVHTVITDAALRNDQELPPLRKEDLDVKLNKTAIQPAALIPAQGQQGALQLMILIDETLSHNIGNNLNDLKNLITALPQGSQVGVAYMSNTTITIGQNFTTDHALAAKAIRLPRGSLSAMDSSFFSLISLLKGWPQEKVRREVIMVTDGIDRLHGDKPAGYAGSGGGMYMGSMGAMERGYGGRYRGQQVAPVYHSMPTMSLDADTASELSQRYNVVVFTIYSPGIGRAGRGEWDRQLGISNLTQLSDETGGECFSLSTSNPVSFTPYTDQILRYINNQYYLVFDAPRGKKDMLQRVNVRTNTKNSEIIAPDNVWVGQPPKTEK